MEKHKILIVIDMQDDFITGTLGSDQAKSIVPYVCEKIKDTDADKIFYTMDTHEAPFYNSTIEGKTIPPHCILHENGWYIHPNVAHALSNVLVDVEAIEKDTFGSLNELPEAINIYCAEKRCTNEDFTIEIIGLCTDICVISNALILRAAFPHTRIVVDAKGCAGSTLDHHEAALRVMQANCIDVVNWE